jgi:hypothetical protein
MGGVSLFYTEFEDELHRLWLAGVSPFYIERNTTRFASMKKEKTGFPWCKSVRFSLCSEELDFLAMRYDNCRWLKFGE